MNYTEEDIRNAFKAGLTKGKHQSYFDAPLDEDEYVEELKQVKNNFALADVSGRSEQLNCDHEWRVEKFDCYGFPAEKYCDKCCKKEAV